MQIYTKILLGMLVGVLLGALFGPRSPLMPADTYKIARWDRLVVRTDKDDPSTTIPLPEGPKREPLRLLVLEVEHEHVVDLAGVSHELPAWSRVRLPWTRELAMRDEGQTVHDALGAPEIGETREVWVRHEHTALEGGGFSVWPQPISGTGDTMVRWLSPIGTAFLRLIQMVIVPLVFASLAVGVAGLGDVRKLGRVGARTLVLYLVTAAIAVSIGLMLAHLVQPGDFVDAQSRAALQAEYQGEAGAKLAQAADAPSALDTVLGIIPTNPIGALAQGDMLQVIFFALAFGSALTFLREDQSKPVVALLDHIQNAMVVLIELVMKLAPFGVAALLAEVVGTSGLDVLGALLAYGGCVVLGLVLHTALVYVPMIRSLAKLPVRGFFRAIRPAMLIAFSTSSSNATLPVTMESAEKRLGMSNGIASFALPLGATVHMDGTALYQGVAAVFIAQVFGLDLGIGDQLAIVLTATLAAVGAAGVPGAGMVTLALVLTTAGIPTVGVALILGLDRILDMFRTTVNVTGDIVVAAVVARGEGEALYAVEDDPPPVNS